MVLKSAIAAIACAIIILASGGSSRADEYRPDEYLNLDLSKAVLSPKRLGPPTEFAPVPIEAKADRRPAAAQASTEQKPDRKVVQTTRVTRTERITQAHAGPPRHAARVKLAK